MSTRAEYGKAIEAARYQFNNALTDEEAAELFEVKPGSIKHARHRHNIPHPFPKKRMGVAIHAAKVFAYTDATMEEAMKISNVSRDTLACAARRLGIKVRRFNPNRNITILRNAYYFRVRTKEMNAHWSLGKDIVKARIMRDKLEEFFKTLK